MWAGARAESRRVAGRRALAVTARAEWEASNPAAAASRSRRARIPCSAVLSLAPGTIRSEGAWLSTRRMSLSTEAVSFCPAKSASHVHLRQRETFDP